jgi:hypothetical protein
MIKIIKQKKYRVWLCRTNKVFDVSFFFALPLGDNLQKEAKQN